MGATNHPGDTSTNLGDKLNSLIEPALTDLGTKIPGWGWIVGAYESIKEWFQASSDFRTLAVSASKFAGSQPSLTPDDVKNQDTFAIIPIKDPTRRFDDLAVARTA